MKDQFDPYPRKRFHHYALPIYLALAFVAGMAVAVSFFTSNKKVFYDESKKMEEILYYIDKYYVDSVDTKELFETTINTMLQSLDPHSSYSNAEENKMLVESLEGAFEGIGIQFSIMEDTVTVIATVSGGPSEKVGIRTGDKIMTVNGKNIAGIGIKNEEVMKLLRGEKNTKVKLGIKRMGFKKLYNFDLLRDVIPTYTLDVAYMIDKKTGYVKINQFGETTGKEFADALIRLKSQGMKKLILDLRGNPGGYLDAGILVCDELLPKGDMIVYTEGLKVKSDKIHATSYGNFEAGELVVLIDDFSASASEIVAGAVQDNDRGTIVGRRSFGKGLIQRQIDLSDQSSLRITTSRYHTPSGRCIQKDYHNGTDEYNEELFNRYINGEMESADSIKFDPELQYKTIKGRTVYGGGGIMPDFFVPVDRDSNMTAFYQLLNSGVLSQFAFDYTSKNQNVLKNQFPNVATFLKNMHVSETLYQELIDTYKKQNNDVLKDINRLSKEESKLWLKAFIGRILYQEEGFYPIINRSDKVILKALEL